jgi:ribosomal protein S18 acetylase RimI-like enzyme
MTPHALDRPIWGALRGRQAPVSVGNDRARRYLGDISPLAAAADDSPESLAALAAIAPSDGALVLLQVGEIPLPQGLELTKSAKGVQMVASEPVARVACDFSIVELQEADAPEMVALATLTEPGPFLSRTHRLGRFLGVRIDGRLAAMAGERMKLDGFTEISGVCTHPDFRGRGLAGALSAAVAASVRERGETPFLHAYASNTPAIRLYERLGFRLRCEVDVAVLQRRSAIAR